MMRGAPKPRAAAAVPAAAFLTPPPSLAQAGARRSGFLAASLPSTAPRGLRRLAAAPARGCRLPRMVVDGDGPTASAPPPSTDVPTAGGVSQLTGPARAAKEEKLRKAQSEAERLKQLAAEARYAWTRVGRAPNFLGAGVWAAFGVVPALRGSLGVMETATWPRLCRWLLRRAPHQRSVRGLRAWLHNVPPGLHAAQSPWSKCADVSVDGLAWLPTRSLTCFLVFLPTAPACLVCLFPSLIGWKRSARR